MKDYEAYAVGFVHISVCSSLDPLEVVQRVNEEHPTGLEWGWKIDENNFASGEANPCPCNTDPETHRHYLMVC